MERVESQQPIDVEGALGQFVTFMQCQNGFCKLASKMALSICRTEVSCLGRFTWLVADLRLFLVFSNCGIVIFFRLRQRLYVEMSGD